MLILSRHVSEQIVIEVPPGTETRQIFVFPVDIRSDKTRIGIVADKDIAVHRKEIWDAIQRGEIGNAQQPPSP